MPGDPVQKARVKGRFAPSPSGRIHAGNIYAALVTWLLVKKRGGTILLRIEDLDTERSKRVYIDRVQADLEALGLSWDEGPLFQSKRGEAYRQAYDMLCERDLVYPCFCTRAQIKAVRGLATAPHLGEGGFYPGTCRNIPVSERPAMQLRAEAEGSKYSFRIATDARRISFMDIFQGDQYASLDPTRDDFIIRRSDGLFAYQLAVVVDDADAGVNLICRGIDLLPSTPKQVYLQQLLGFDMPLYAHVPLFVNAEGKRLAKRDRAAAFEELLHIYKTPEKVIGHIAHKAGIVPEDGISVTPEGLLPYFDEDALRERYEGMLSIAYS